jgi:alpha-L-rhamnosidase
MFAYTLRCLTLGGKIVDCPHFERMGYGGDGNACTMTAQTLYGMHALYTTWLTHWSDCMDQEGSLPHTAPAYWTSGGGPYWCAFIVKAAWETYLNYGDMEILRNHYPEMVNWLKYVQEQSPDILLEKWPLTNYRNWFLGDWATPEGVDQTDPRSVGLVSNCAIADSYDKMIKIAALLDKPSEAQYFEEKRDELHGAIHKTFYNPEEATYATGVQIDLAYPLILGIVPDSLVDEVTVNLYEETMVKRDGHLATGLVGLRILTDWIIEQEASDMMYEMLSRKDYPGFVYMLENGATTTWEHWEGKRSRIHNCYHGAGHWFYQSLGGIRPMETYPGYERFILAPRPPEELSWASITKETAFGTILVDWKKEEGEMIIDLTVPPGSMAGLQLPVGVESCLCGGELLQPDMEGNIWIQSGTHSITYGL